MEDIVWALIFAIILVFVGNLLGKTLPVLDRFALPGAVIGGVIALLLGPQILNPELNLLPKGFDLSALFGQLAGFPGLFINLVFACLMLGRRFGTASEIWSRAKPQVVMGHVFAWGQYVVGLALVLFLLAPMFDTNELAGTVIAIGFQGGHGTAAGLGQSFADLGFENGEAFAMAVATVGIISGVILGPLLANFLARKYALPDDEEDNHDSDEQHRQSDIPQVLKPNPLTGRLTMHLGLVVIVVCLGWLLLQGLSWAEHTLRSGEVKHYLTDYIPLFSLVLICGMAVQGVLQMLNWDVLFDRDLFEKISSFSLDMVIFSALATLSLDVISSNWQALAALCLAGIGWNLAVLFLIGPRVYRSPWHAYGMGDVGGGTATTASGILLIKVVDPKNKTDALNAYADKQPFYEPIMGGGLVTAMALPTVALWGPWVALALTGSILAGWLWFAWRIHKKAS